ncbi:MAG TPA: hypothetical protein VFX28_13420 [Methylomirabilota bacterium]|nr:hypothetical protein [Methylomirabilota bacterium]
MGALALWAGLLLALPGVPADALGLLAAVLTATLAWPPPLRAVWRPVTGVATLLLSGRLRPGDRAWYVRPGGADLVLITGRRGVRLIVARGAGDAAEGFGVRRTRVLLLPADE